MRYAVIAAFAVIWSFFSMILEANDTRVGITQLQITTPQAGPFFLRPNPPLAEGEVQWMKMEFFTGNLFEQNPNSHLWIMITGRMGEYPKPIRGRGIAFGNTIPATECESLAFEHFAGDRTVIPYGNVHPGRCGDFVIKDYTWYKFILHANENGISYWIYEKDSSIFGDFGYILIDNDWTPMPVNVNDQADIVMGVALDYNTSNYVVRDLRWGHFFPGQ